MSTGPITTMMMRKMHVRAPRALYASVKTTPLSPSYCLPLFVFIRRKSKEVPRQVFYWRDRFERAIKFNYH